jgi:hypothetical protein
LFNPKENIKQNEKNKPDSSKPNVGMYLVILGGISSEVGEVFLFESCNFNSLASSLHFHR